MDDETVKRLAKELDELELEQLPLDVEGINSLAPKQSDGFWLREICIQLAGVRELLAEIREKIL